MMLSDAAMDRYIKHPYSCPYCGADEIDADRLEKVMEAFAVQPVSCSVCDKMWNDVYLLTAIEEVVAV